MSHETPSTARLRFARALLPSLLHDIGNSTQRLVGVRAILEFEDAALGASAGADLAWASARAEDHGWLLGVLAEALGVEGLLQRRSAHGLTSTLRLVAAGLARERRTLSWNERESPRLAVRSTAPNSAALCASLGSIVFEAGMSTRPDCDSLELLFQRSDSHVSMLGSRGAAAAQQAVRECSAALEGVTCDAVGELWTVRAPQEWFDFAAT